MDHQTVAAHRIAKHLRAIATLKAFLSPMARVELALLSRGSDFGTVAQAIEVTAPVRSFSDADREIVIEALIEQASDMSTRAAVQDVTADWTDAEWWVEYDNLVENAI